MSQPKYFVLCIFANRKKKSLDSNGGEKNQIKQINVNRTANCSDFIIVPVSSIILQNF